MRKSGNAIVLGLCLAAAAAVACGSEAGPGGLVGAGDPPTTPDPAATTSPDPTSPDPGTPPAAPTCTGDPIGTLDKGATQLAKLCARGYADPVSKAFCASTTPTITSVSDVLKAVGLDFKAGQYLSGQNGNPAFVLTAQSTSLATRMVSQINPRALIFTPPLARGRMTTAPKPNASYVAIGFTRGDQAIEILAKDPTMNGGKGDIRFFLLKYEQACNAKPGGCKPGDLYTPAVESGFTGWSLYDDEDLKNTTLDCRQCHQPGGPGTARMMRMQELQFPWQHWMYNDAVGSGVLRADFHAAHGTTEAYGGIPAQAIDHNDAPHLEGFVENNGFQMQPNEYQGKTILSELNATPGASATWQSQYQAASNGQFIPVPYYDFNPADPSKLQALTAQYRAVATGALSPDQLGDLRDIFSDAQKRAMTHKPAPNLSGRQILVQACQQCHNSRLDQTISRSRFDVEKLDTLTRAEKDEAIRRINLPVDACSHMPPTRFRDLDAADIALVEAELKK